MRAGAVKPSTGKQRPHSEVLAEVDNLTFSYPDAPAPILKGVKLSIRSRELIILAGPSGCGKSTLCRHLNGIIPHLSSGEDLAGKVVVKGKDTNETAVHTLATHVGMVFQNPESQLCCLQAEDELAFGPENLGLSHEEIVARVNKVVDWVSLDDIRKSLIFELSGGQKQKVAIGSSLALLPELLVLDEPTTDLDPVGAQHIVSTLRSLRDKLGLTFLVVEHDLDELLEIADRLIVMDRGQILLDGTPRDLFNNHYREMEAIGLRIPQHVVMARGLAKQHDPEAIFPISRQEAIAAFAEWADRLEGLKALPTSKQTPGQGAPKADTMPAIKLDNVTFSYDGKNNAVEHIDLEVSPGEFLALVGANGSGKSTLARLAVGLLHPQVGEVTIMDMNTRRHSPEAICKRVGYLFQNPDSQLFSSTAESEVAFGMRIRKMPEEQINHKVKQVLSMLGLERFRDRHPFGLSRGERQRLAVATVLVTDPDIIILDEPTTGQDRRMLDHLISLMRAWIQRKNATVLMICHDMGLVCQHATRTVVLREGHIVCDGSTSEVFHRSYETLKEMSLLPPAIVEASYPFVGSKFSRVLLSMDEFERLLGSAGDERHRRSLPTPGLDR